MTLEHFLDVDFADVNNPYLVPIGISNSHIHVSEQDLAILFGAGHKLAEKKALSQPGQFAAEEVVCIVGPKGRIEKMRILGPTRAQTQVEISQTEARKMGISAPMRESGKLAGSAPVTVIGPCGTVELTEGCIVALTHLHLSLAQGELLQIADKDLVDIYLRGDGKTGMLFGVLARVGGDYEMDLHIDTDEANAFRVANGAKAFVMRRPMQNK